MLDEKPIREETEGFNLLRERSASDVHDDIGLSLIEELPIWMLCARLTSTGAFHGVNHTAIRRRKNGCMTRACLERSYNIIIFINHWCA